MSHIIFKKDRVMETLEDELAPLVRLKKVEGHLETSEGKTIDADPIPDGIFDIVLAQMPTGEYWINSCTWCHEYEQKIYESGANAYELKPCKDVPPRLSIPIQLYYCSSVKSVD